jgi:hypothetical protein
MRRLGVLHKRVGRVQYCRALVAFEHVRGTGEVVHAFLMRVPRGAVRQRLFTQCAVKVCSNRRLQCVICFESLLYVKKIQLT